MRRRTDVTWRIGTIGFGYSPWRGVFYPRELKSNEYLSYYVSRFDCVELDTTFHAMPTAERVRVWAEQVDDDFRFAVKTPKQITHEGAIDQRIDLMRAFIEACRPFEQKLGMVLVQFPPGFDTSQGPALMRFLDRVRDVPIAIEFRHPSWFEQGAVRSFEPRGVTVVANDYMDRTQPILSQGPIYLRLIGEHERFSRYQAEEWDTTDRLQWWIDRVEQAARPGVIVYALLSNDYAGYAVGTAERLKGLLGLPLKRTETMVSLFE